MTTFTSAEEPAVAGQVVLFSESRAARAARKAERDKVSRSLHAIANWVAASADELTEEEETMINKILATHSMKSQVFLVAAAHQQIKKILDMMEMQESAEDYLREILDDDEKRAGLKFDDVRKLIDSIHTRMIDGMDFLNTIGQQNLPSSLHPEDNRPKLVSRDGSKRLFNSPNKREGLRNLLEKMVQVVSEESEEALKPVKEDKEPLVDLDTIVKRAKKKKKK